MIGVDFEVSHRQPVRSAGVEAQHPVANDLQTDAADPRIRPAATIVDLGQRQQTTALGRVPGPLREARSETLSKSFRTIGAAMANLIDHIPEIPNVQAFRSVVLYQRSGA